MNWTKHDDYAIRSGSYSITRVNVAMRIDYELWRGSHFITSRRDVRPDDKSRLTAINELKEEADEYDKPKAK